MNLLWTVEFRQMGGYVWTVLRDTRKPISTLSTPISFSVFKFLSLSLSLSPKGLLVVIALLYRTRDFQVSNCVFVSCIPWPLSLQNKCIRCFGRDGWRWRRRQQQLLDDVNYTTFQQGTVQKSWLFSFCHVTAHTNL